MIPPSPKFHWMAPEPTASALAKKIISINKHAWNLLARLNEDQVIDLIIIVEESIENFSSLLVKPKYGDVKPGYGKFSSLDYFKGFYSKMDLYIDDESLDDYNGPENLDVLEVFAALAASKASYALEFLAGRNISTAHLEKFGSVEAAASALASDAAIEAAEALVVGYAEFKRLNEFFTAEEHEERRRENIRVRATKGGAGNSKRYQPLREKAYQLYDRLVAKSKKPMGDCTAARAIHADLYNFAVEIGLIENVEESDDAPLKQEEALAERTIYRWLSIRRKKQELQATKKLDTDI